MHRLHLAHLDPDDRFVTPSYSDGFDCVLRGEDAHHARRVRRARPGEPVAILDGLGSMWKGTVIDTPALGRDDLAVRFNQHTTEPEPIRVDIAACAPKTGRLGDMIDMLAQVGVSRWIPLLTERSGDAERVRYDKLQRVAREAAKQCGRLWDLHITEPCSLDDALSDGLSNGISDRAMLLVAHAGGVPLPSALSNASARTDRRVAPRVLIGPEGGWSDAELLKMHRAGAMAVGLGPNVLRIETAAVVAAAAVRAWADMVAASDQGPITNHPAK